MKAKFSLAALFAVQITAAHAAVSPLAETSESLLKQGSVPFSLTPSAKVTDIGSVVALNQGSYVGNQYYPAGTEFIVGEGAELFASLPDSEEPIATGVKLSALPTTAYTVLEVDAATGELLDFNIPNDYKLAGKGGKHSRRRGVTPCYHVGKAAIGRRIRLTGGSAYMAAAQLQSAGWHRYDYESAPKGAACVFGPGGRHTTSGGQRHGHFGIKGRGGIINPASGFALGRPFLGCYNEV